MLEWTLNEIAVQAITEALGLVPETPRRRYVHDILGARPNDGAFEVELDAQRQIDPVLWR